MKENEKIERGDIFCADLSNANLLMGGTRPVIIISNIVINRHSNNVIVVPLKSKANHMKIPTYVDIEKDVAGLLVGSVAITEMITFIPKTLLVSKIGSLPEKTMDKINRALTICISSATEVKKIIQIQSEMIFNKVINVEEDVQYEFKEITGNPVNHVKKNIAEYICGYLNSKGGRILYGIDNSGVIKGVELSRKQKDEIRTSINAEIRKMHPALDPTRYNIDFHDVYTDGKEGVAINDLYVLEVLIMPPLDSRILYFAGDHHAYVKVPGGLNRLNGSEIQELIKNRLLS